MHKFLLKKRKGFSGITHLLSSLCLMALCMIIPIPLLHGTFLSASQNILLFIVCFIVLSGASLLPDLDNDVSTAGYSLGFFGSIIKGFMKSTASIMWSLYHGKNDKPPVSAHRLMWHAPIIGIGLMLLFAFCIPNTGLTIFQSIQEAFNGGSFIGWLANNSVLFIFILLVTASCLCGSNILLYWPMKILPVSGSIKRFADFFLPIAVIIYVFTAPYSAIRLIGICIGAGYLFHCIGDLITQGSIPIIWPIPAFWKKQVYWSPWVPFAVKTGGFINTILNFVFAILAVILFLIAFGLMK